VQGRYGLGAVTKLGRVLEGGCGGAWDECGIGVTQRDRARVRERGRAREGGREREREKA